MSTQSLPQELVALVHHVELNKSGWWQDALQRLALSMLADTTPRSTPQIVGVLHKDFGIVVSEPVVRKALIQLRDSGSAMLVAQDIFKISEKARNDVLRATQECAGVDAQAYAFFEKLMVKGCPELEAKIVWQKFCDNFLFPIIKTLGASAYQMLTRSATSVEHQHLEKFLDAFDSKYHPALKRIAAVFLSNDAAEARSFVLARLNAHFFVVAANLSQEHIEVLSEAMSKKPRFNIFVDTNFLFSLLGLHENPSNQSSSSLRELLQSVSNRVDVKLYVTAITLDEARKVLMAARLDMRRIPSTRNVMDAIPEHELGGICQTFVENAKRNPQISADAYFGPYIEGLMLIARTKGVELYNAPIDALSMDPDVLNDVNARMEFEADRGRKRKSYEQLVHDFSLWHFVQRLRPRVVESPLEAGSWIVTVDYGFMGIDRFKTSRQGGVPVCLHPTTLVQLLQFWVPRDPKLDAALFASLNLRTSFYEFDPGSERATLRILQTLSRFENVSDLPTPTVTALLVNAALRNCINREDSEDEELALVKLALIEEHKKAELELEEERKRYAESQKLIVEHRNHAAELQGKVTSAANEVAVAHKKATEAEERAKKLADELAADRKLAEEQKLERERSEKARVEREERALAKHRSRWGLLVVTILTLGAGATALWLGDGQNWWQKLGSSSAALGGALFLSRWIAAHIVGEKRLPLLSSMVRWLCGG